MFRCSIRLGVVALLFLLSLSAVPAQALPLPGDDGGSAWSLSALWERLFGDPVVSRETEDSRGLCDPNGAGCVNGFTTPDTRGICDPNGGDCNS